MDCVDIKVGFACNNDCVHCVAADKRPFGDLTTDRIRQEIDFYREHTDAVLVLTGGEPTIRKDLPELVRHARAAGFLHVELQTNGRALSSPRIAGALAEAGLTGALIALHSPVPEVHDAISQRRGAFRQTTAGMRNLAAHGVAVRTNTVLSRANLDQLEALATYLADEHPSVTLAQLTFPHPNGSAYVNMKSIVPPLPDAAAAVLGALRRGLRRGIWFLVEAIPPCLLPGFEKRSLDIREREVVGTDVAAGAPDSRIADYRELLRGDKRKGDQCSQCSLDGICDGIWREYAEWRGTAELRPVRNIDPQYLLACD